MSWGWRSENSYPPPSYYTGLGVGTALLCLALGFALAVQVGQSTGDQLSSLRQDELVMRLHRAGVPSYILCPGNITGPYSFFVQGLVDAGEEVVARSFDTDPSTELRTGFDKLGPTQDERRG